MISPSTSRVDAGFTLLELVVVILIMGVLITFASLSVGSRPLEDKLETEARRTQAIVQLAAEEAEAKGVEIGLRFSSGGYRLLAVDGASKWDDYEEQGTLRRRLIAEPVRLGLRIEGRPVVLPPEDPQQTEAEQKSERSSPTAAVKKIEPQVLLLSSGEMTPFSLDLAVPGLGFLYRLEGDELGKLSLNRVAIPRG